MTLIHGWMLAPLALLLVVAGCAGIDRRAVTGQLSLAQSAVAAAENSNSKTFSPENLRHAQDALALAQDAVHNQAWEQAASFARKSWLYARLAQALSGQKLSEEKLETLRKSSAPVVPAAREDHAVEAPAAEPKP